MSSGGGMTQGRARPPLSRWVLHYGLGGCCTLLLAALAGLTVVDVIGRYWFNAPVAGAFELTQMMLCALVFAALPLTTKAGEHVEVDLAYGLVGTALQKAMRVLGATVSAVVLWAIAWRLALHALRLAEDGAVTNAWSLPLAPLAWFAAATAAVSGGLALLRQWQRSGGEVPS